MSDLQTIPATSVNSAYWAVLQGRLAAGCAVPNPYGERARALSLCWAWGRAGAKPYETVSRGTARDAWRAEQLEVLRLARSGGQGHLSDLDLAAIVGKSHAAVRVKLTRLRKESGA